MITKHSGTQPQPLYNFAFIYELTTWINDKAGRKRNISLTWACTCHYLHIIESPSIHTKVSVSMDISHAWRYESLPYNRNVSRTKLTYCLSITDRLMTNSCPSMPFSIPFTTVLLWSINLLLSYTPFPLFHLNKLRTDVGFHISHSIFGGSNICIRSRHTIYNAMHKLQCHRMSW